MSRQSTLIGTSCLTWQTNVTVVEGMNVNARLTKKRDWQHWQEQKGVQQSAWESFTGLCIGVCAIASHWS